jgi:hypothetical protein
MTEPLGPRNNSRAKKALLVGFGLLVLVIVLGFNRGWLAWHSNAQPVGKLRPADLIGPTTSSPQVSSSSRHTTSSEFPTPGATLVPIDDDHSSVPVSSKIGSTASGSSVTLPNTPGDHDHDHDHDEDD